MEPITITKSCWHRTSLIDLVGARTSTSIDRATDWMMANWPIPVIAEGSRRTAARIHARHNLTFLPEQAAPQGRGWLTDHRFNRNWAVRD
jgi:hypothetical protein